MSEHLRVPCCGSIVLIDHVDIDTGVCEACQRDEPPDDPPDSATTTPTDETPSMHPPGIGRGHRPDEAGTPPAYLTTCPDCRTTFRRRSWHVCDGDRVSWPRYVNRFEDHHRDLTSVPPLNDLERDALEPYPPGEIPEDTTVPSQTTA